MTKSKGDMNDIIDSQFLKQDRYRKRQHRIDTYSLADKRASRKCRSNNTYNLKRMSYKKIQMNSYMDHTDSYTNENEN